MQPQDEETIKECVHVLLQYCERLMVQRNALQSVVQKLPGPTVQAHYSRVHPEIDRNLEAAFHPLYAYLRVGDWSGLRNTALQALDKLVEKPPWVS